ncbi:MAG TPA: ATP synthase subunit I [Desulfomonilaceae bacterium]|nr:ATP synthase subunit I [Desulfomonilaceae bacterium]
MDSIPRIWFMLSGVVYVSGIIFCLFLAPQGFTLGFVTGGGLVLVNAWASARKLKKSEFLHRGRALASVLGGFYLRLVVLAICLFGVIKFLHVDPVGLVTGLSVIPAGLLAMLVLIYIANRRPEEA